MISKTVPYEEYWNWNIFFVRSCTCSDTNESLLKQINFDILQILFSSDWAAVEGIEFEYIYFLKAFVSVLL